MRPNGHWNRVWWLFITSGEEFTAQGELALGAEVAFGAGAAA
jgi:hypothetical protein